MVALLRIGELASYVGVTTRTVRFYHQQGLLDEPQRNTSGYRLYDGEAVLRLSRVVALASAGVPLARVHELLDASQESLDLALAEIDADLSNRIERLEKDRDRLRLLRAGDALVFPDVIVGLITHLRKAGIDPDVVDHYRDAWVLTYAVYRPRLDPWLESVGGTMLRDPGYLALMVRSFRAAELEPEDPRIQQLADDTVEWMVNAWDSDALEWSFERGLDDPAANSLLEAQWADRPAWVRVTELIVQGLQERGIEHPRP
ncbi:MerR family transcriptional regulator [Rhodococcus sp. IEGM 1401]|uniref:MerR family transcriptional regulator n=1 Tax=unclassified Rhodococcus (in: high G+C Gram-positive bacteria) TaxID=192944 RepID=UPI0022B52767|nr:MULTISPECIES: MerR family transcriptional regulator [unclassified Rhodococcus (in: high G+C Gram-positive bacteria)]MCZ4561649.1 MerR family transcriptional regulator [Rhodococcus sp. IEGM 1401]MDI9921731.1 MerR family transcriptional regulator [Rhodococcus sp. IEGM 1372]MDV8034244.1 MerR family transcriptional regulator [Rhodococcus sp. IEGM 1414]